MRPLVLLHGAGGAAAAWGPTLPAWAWAEVTTPDLPGRGASPGPPLADVPSLAAWLARSLEAWGLEAPIVLGHSLGGGLALQLALDHPGRVGALVLVSSSARLRVHPNILAAVAASTPEAPFRLDFGFGPGTPQAVIDAYAEACAPTPPTSALADWRACDGFDVRDRLSEVKAPTLVLHGSEDPLTPARFQASLAAALPHAERVELAGRGHMLPWEAPEATSQAVQRWASRL